MIHLEQLDSERERGAEDQGAAPGEPGQPEAQTERHEQEDVQDHVHRSTSPQTRQVRGSGGPGRLFGVRYRVMAPMKANPQVTSVAPK
jgi:hypothetical protein